MWRHGPRRTKCLPGEYSDLEVQQSVQHVRNITFQLNGCKCVLMSDRKKSSSDRTECLSCSWIYQGSKHCEVAVTESLLSQYLWVCWYFWVS